jgi:hypothetical protein
MGVHDDQYLHEVDRQAHAEGCPQIFDVELGDTVPRQRRQENHKQRHSANG